MMNRTPWGTCIRGSGVHIAAGLLALLAAGCAETGAGGADADADRIAGADCEVSPDGQADETDRGQPVIGEPFPYTQFITGDGQVVDLAQATDSSGTHATWPRIQMMMCMLPTPLTIASRSLPVTGPS